MLQEPMMEKLTAMRLQGMVDALKAQEQDPAAGELSFMERLGLLVDQQWTWRENQALARRLHADRWFLSVGSLNGVPRHEVQSLRATKRLANLSAAARAMLTRRIMPRGELR